MQHTLTDLRCQTDLLFNVALSDTSFNKAIHCQFTIIQFAILPVAATVVVHVYTVHAFNKNGELQN